MCVRSNTEIEYPTKQVEKIGGFGMRKNTLSVGTHPAMEA